MTKHSLLSFIEEASKALADLAVRIEEQLYEQPQASLMQARLYSEQLVKMVSDMEGLEAVYPLKHAERIHKLYRQNVIEEETYMKMEWIRKKGNKAAHDMQNIDIKDVFQAHRFLFDISVWYMEVYVRFDFEAPLYKLPERVKQQNVITEDEIDKVVQPYLDERLKKMDAMWSEVQRELDVLKKEKERINQLQKEETKEITKQNTASNSYPLLKYLQDNGLEYVDNRNKKGLLWILGDWSINEKLLPLKKEKIYFRFSKKGGKASDYKPAWFLLNKSLVDTSHLEDNQPEEPTITMEEKEEPTAHSIAVTTKTVTDDYWQSKGQLLIPVHLLDQPLSAYTLPFVVILKKLQDLTMFNQITEELLRKLYLASRADFHKVMLDLYWLGFRFTGKLYAFQPEKSVENDSELIVEPTFEQSMEEIVPMHMKELLQRHSIVQVKDLNHFLNSSLQLVFKKDTDYLISQLLQCKQQNRQDDTEQAIEPALASRLEEDVEGKTESLLQLKLNDQSIFISSELANQPIKDLGINGCNHLLNVLYGNGIHTLKQLPNVLDHIHLTLTNVGPKAVQKMWSQLREMNGVKKKGDSVSQEEIDGKVISYGQGNIHIPPAACKAELNLIYVAGLEKTIKILQENQIHTIEDLPNILDSIGSINGIGRTKIQRLFESLPLLIEKVLLEDKLNQMPDNERLQYEFDCYNEWFEDVNGSEEMIRKEKIGLRYLPLMKERYLAAQEGKHLTLEALGQMEDITRERVRQIIKKGDLKVVEKTKDMISILKKKLQERKMIDVHDWKDTFSAFVLREALEGIDIYFASYGGKWFMTEMDHNSRSEYINDLQQNFQQIFDMRYITKEMIEAFIHDRAEKDRISESALYAFVDEFIHWISEEQGVLNNLKKNKAVEMVLLQYPEGVEVYKNEEELNEKANQLMPGSFQGERAFTSVLNRENVQETIVLWGRGVYIHSTFITKDEEWVRSVQELAAQWLEEEEFIHVLKLYKEVQSDALKRDVPNEYALYTLIRKYPTSALSLPKFPTIIRAGESRIANSQWIMNYIEEQERPVPYEELYDVFVEKRGWKKFTLEFTLSSSDAIIPYKHATYTLLSKYDSITKEDVDLPIQEIQQELITKPFIGISGCYYRFEPLLNAKGIETKRVFYYVLKKIGIPNVAFPRYPYILNEMTGMDDISGRNLVENFMKDRKEIVSREEVQQFLEDLYGHQNAVLDISLQQSGDILYYSRGQFGEYVHRDIVGLKEEKLQSVLAFAQKKANEIMVQMERNYVLLPELYIEEELPDLDYMIPWSMELFGDVLKKSEEWKTIGSYDEIVVPHTSGIQSDLQFIEYILQHHFQGNAKVNEMKEFLMDIRYSSNGQLLFEVEEALKNSESAFEQIGDEYMTHQLSGVKKHE